MTGNPPYRANWPPPEHVAPPKRPPDSLSPHTFLDEVGRVLARQGIHGQRQPEDMNAATALEAAGRLLLALGVTPDIQLADRTEGARRIRELMAAAGRQVCT
jgi:hypothetical protein